MANGFQIVTLTPGLLRPSIAVASHRAGEIGALDFEHICDREAATRSVHSFNGSLQGHFGLKFGERTLELAAGISVEPPEFLKLVIFSCDRPCELAETVRLFREKGIATLLEATNLEHASKGESAGFSGVIAKGNEAGGRVGDETAFILLQRFQSELRIPVWVHGGIGLHTAAACAAAGAAGILLDTQLALTRESPLPEALKAKIASMDGSETICLGEQIGEAFRLYFRPGNPVIKELQAVEISLVSQDRPLDELRREWRRVVFEKVGWDPDKNAVMLGQDGAFAAALAKQFRTVGGVLRAVRNAVRTHTETAERLRPLAPDSPLARSHGTAYPIMQGPMTRVSDVPEFAAQVAEGGALPFLALALMRGSEVQTLLAQARERLGPLPWGVGILGFVPPELRQEQMEVIAKYRPPFALIAGGRPDQAKALERQGIPTYLHVPSPGLLELFVRQGARRFVFEGRECGGHVGPRTSFVLWSQMIDVLLGAADLETAPEEFHVVFAAGIHDAASAAMVSVLAAPLAQRGVRIGVLIGSAYLFTAEAVSSGAILSTFQEQAQSCKQTVLLETGPGHSTRCVDTPFATAFLQEKRRLMASGLAAEDIRMTLEDLNLGRLRMASKGTARNGNFGDDPAAPKLIELQKHEQVTQGMYMIGQVAALRHTIGTVSELHRDISVEGSNRLQGLAARFTPASSVRRETPSDVAVIGMSCLLPKAPDLESYWNNIVNKVNAITEVPTERWDPAMYYDPDPKAKDKIYSKWGGFLDDIVFDPMQYGMPPSSLRSIEPSQLLTLEVVRAALRDAGYLDRPFARDRTSVILGAGGGAADLGLGYGARSFIPTLENLPEFEGRSREILEQLGSRLPEWTEDSFAGILTNVSAGRVANRFDLGGSNYTVDAACASSLAAVSLALKELEGHTSDMVIVGGIDTMQNPFTYLCFSKTHALSPRGRCRTFDETADGIAISEGIAMLIFKRLEDAERDGDRVYAVIKGAGSSSDGKDRGLTAPRPEGQARALRRAYAKAGFSPATVGLVEAHGTGTVAGDGAEVQALTQVFAEFGAERQACAIGSVKSMIGHTKCSAGAAGLIKAALALHHRVLPPTLGVETPNPRARFPETPFFVNTERRPWLENANGEPRRAGVSAFGFGGTNFHIAMEEYTGDSAGEADACPQWPDELFRWAASSRESLIQAVDVWRKALSEPTIQPRLRDLAYTAWRKSEEPFEKTDGPRLHLSIVAGSLDDLRQKLDWALEGLTVSNVPLNDPRGVYFTDRPLGLEAKLAFLFPGQGSQYPRMMEDLLIHFPEMQDVFARAARTLAGKLEQPLNAYIFPPFSFNKEEEQARQQALTQTNVAQPALGAACLAMFGLLRELGLRPDMMAGHSYGEYAALAAAGVFDPETLIALSEARGRFIVECAGEEPGTMAALEVEAAAVSEVIQSFEGVCIANVNAPKQTVVSGTQEGVNRIAEHFAARGVTVRRFAVACAFHSPLVAHAQKPLAEFLAAVPVSKSEVAVYSNTTATPYPEQPAEIAALLVEHLVKPVDFAREIEAMYDAGARVFVEVGPRGVLTGLVERTLEDRPKLAVASNQSGRSGVTQLLHLLGQLASQSVPLQLERLFRERNVTQLDLADMVRKEQPLSASAWLVNGARAKPGKEAAQPLAPVAAPNTPVLTHPIHSQNSASRTASHPTQPAFEAAGAPAMADPALSLEGVPQVMAHFQQMMTRFLEAQQSIMLSYLGTASGSASGTVPTVVSSHQYSAEPAPIPAPSAIVAQPYRNGAAPIPTEPMLAQKEAIREPVAVPSGPDLKELTTRLLTIVSDRTGYPAEMLDLNLDLEADLGIDSIKRVEILGTFQQSFATTGISLGEGILEQLAGVRTLQAIVDRVAEQLSGPDVAEAVSSRVAAAGQPAKSGPTGEELTIQLLAIVSERTGYPADMLGLDLDLEADLGIDSIKRVEILGTFQQSFAAAGVEVRDGMMEQLAGVRTLRGILDRINETGSEQPSRPEAKAIVSAPASIGPIQEELSLEANRIGRFTLHAVERPLRGERNRDRNGRTVLITDDGTGVARVIGDELAADGRTVATVRHGKGFQELGTGSYEADLGSPERTAELVRIVTERQGALGGIIHLYPLRQGTGALGVKSLFYLARAAHGQLQDAASEGAFLVAATGMGGSFLTEGRNDTAIEDAHAGGVVGLTKTLALEWPEVRVKSVDLDLSQSGPALAEHLLQELGATDRHSEIGYREGRRIVLEPRLSPVDTSAAPTFTLDRSSVVLVTGGARGIAARAAYRLAERYQPTIVLVGRSPEPPISEREDTAGIHSLAELKAVLMGRLRDSGEPVTPARVEQAHSKLTAEREIRGNLAALRELGARVEYHSIDVCDSERFGALLDSIYSFHGRIDGVIHAAGVIEDKLIQDKTPASFDRVFHTKVDSAFTLSRKLQPDGLKFLVFFSSVSGRFGNRGQGDYAAANEVLNKLAVVLDGSWPARVVAINWGPWDSGGMVSPEVRKQFAERGVELIPPDVGLRFLEEELSFGRKGQAEIVIGGAGWLPERSGTEQHRPLLETAVATRLKDAYEITLEIDPDTHRYLQDHKLDGQPVFPLAMAAELIAETASEAWPDKQVAAIRDFRLLHGLVFEAGPKTVRVVARPIESMEPGLTAVSVDVIGSGKMPRVHYRAVVELAERLPARPPAEPEPLLPGVPFRKEVAELYRTWLFHGPLFQGIVELDALNASGIGATLATSSPVNWLTGEPKGNWLVDPLTFDSALQLVLVWARQHWDMTALPTGFQRYRRYAPALGSRVRCELRLRPETGAQTIHADIYFKDETTNRIVGVLEDMHGACSTALNRLAKRESLATAGAGS